MATSTPFHNLYRWRQLQEKTPEKIIIFPHTQPAIIIVAKPVKISVQSVGQRHRPVHPHGCGEHTRCQPWRAKRRLVVPSSREAALFSRRALRQRENKVGLRTRRPVIGSQVRSSNELAKLLRSAW